MARFPHCIIYHQSYYSLSVLSSSRWLFVVACAVLMSALHTVWQVMERQDSDYYNGVLHNINSLHTVLIKLLCCTFEISLVLMWLMWLILNV